MKGKHLVLWESRKGQRFGLLVVLGADIATARRGYVLVHCDCGVEKSIMYDSLKHGATKSCGCRTRSWKKSSHIQHGMTHTRQYHLWITARSRARDAAVPFNIEISDVVIPEICPVFGIPLLQTVPRGNILAHDNAPSLDRVVPALGYTKGNVQVISWRANRLKHILSLEEAQQLVKYMEKYGPAK